MLSTRCVFMLVLLVGLHINNVRCSNVQSCIEYNTILPTGTCIEYFQHTKIAHTKETAVALNKNIAEMYALYIPMYVKSDVAGLKGFIKMYVFGKCGRNERISNIIDSLSLPSGTEVEKCLTGIKQYICQVTYPICLPGKSGKIVTAIPCRGKCEEAWNTPSCSFVKPLIKSIQGMIQLCGAVSNSFKKYVARANCNNLPKSNIKDKDYCTMANSYSLAGNSGGNLKSTTKDDGWNFEISMRSAKLNTSPNSPSKQSNIKPLFRNGVMTANTEPCIEYNKILPAGMCLEYFHDTKIAQTKETAVKRNNGLENVYKQYVPLYALYQGKEGDLKRLIKFYVLNKCKSKEKVSSIIDSLSLPSGSEVEKCSADVKKFVCELTHPRCLRSKSGNSFAAIPCRGKCEAAWNTPSCSFVKPLIKTIKKGSEVCGAWSDRITEYTLRPDCSRFLKSVDNKDFCPIGNREEPNAKKLKAIGFARNIDIGPAMKPKSCVKYKSILPSGVCLQYLGNSRIAQSREKVLEVDKNIGRNYMFLDTMLQNPLGAEISGKNNQFWEWIMSYVSESCTDKNKIKRIIESIPVPKLNNIRNCLKENGWYFCHIYHPKCTPPYAERNTISPVCREGCKNNWKTPSCSFFKELQKHYKEINKYCKFVHQEHLDSLFDCNKYPPLDMRHIEKCQLRNITDSPSTTNCYHSNGFNYNGTVSKAGGKECLTWRLDRALNAEMYPTLIKNYCRNPQGIGERPWCYTDMETKAWGYCDDIKRCKTFSSNRQLTAFMHTTSSVVSKTQINVVGFIICLVLLVVIVATVFACRMQKKERIIKEYRQGGNDRPDINYVPVTHDDNI